MRWVASRRRRGCSRAVRIDRSCVQIEAGRSAAEALRSRGAAIQAVDQASREESMCDRLPVVGRNRSEHLRLTGPMAARGRPLANGPSTSAGAGSPPDRRRAARHHRGGRPARPDVIGLAALAAASSRPAVGHHPLVLPTSRGSSARDRHPARRFAPRRAGAAGPLWSAANEFRICTLVCGLSFSERSPGWPADGHLRRRGVRPLSGAPFGRRPDPAHPDRAHRAAGWYGRSMRRRPG